MAVKIRLQRHGRSKRPFYHIVVADARAPRDGRFIERLGVYNPMTVPATIELDRDKAFDWLMKGAQPTDTARAILKFKGILYRKHLARGVAKGALTQEEADTKYQEWVQRKEEMISARKKATADERRAYLSKLSGEAKPYIPPDVVVEESEEAPAEVSEEGAEASAETPAEEAAEAAQEVPTEEPAAETATEESASEEAASEEPAAEQVPEETASEETTAEKPAAEAATEEPAVEAATEEPAAEAATEEPASEEPTAEVAEETAESTDEAPAQDDAPESDEAAEASDTEDTAEEKGDEEPDAGN